MVENSLLVVYPEGYFEENYEEKGPSNWYFVDALGQRVYVKKRSRKAAQEIVDKEFGKGKYTVKADHIQMKYGVEVTAK